jgi:hypothetical protein
MNPYASPKLESQPEVHDPFNQSDWWSHSWLLGDRSVTVLHREPFRFKWFATQVVTFVFVIHQKPENIAAIDSDYAAMRTFASQHKRTWLPFAVQCGYALLPIYVGDSFSDSLTNEIQTRFNKRWCVFHVPSLLDATTGSVYTLRHRSFWGCVYREYIHTTVFQVANAVYSGKLAA